MKTYVHVWQHLAEFLKWEMFQSCRDNQTHTFYVQNQKSYRLWDNVEKYGRARQVADDNIIRRMRFACWITKATDTHSGYVILIAFTRTHLSVTLHAHCLSCSYTEERYILIIRTYRIWHIYRTCHTDGKPAVVPTVECELFPWWQLSAGRNMQQITLQKNKNERKV
jgi:hypothetical protein